MMLKFDSNTLIVFSNPDISISNFSFLICHSYFTSLRFDNLRISFRSFAEFNPSNHKKTSLVGGCTIRRQTSLGSCHHHAEFLCQVHKKYTSKIFGGMQEVY